jgi:hypothetical protein
MQDIITQEILKHSLISFEVGKKIIDRLFTSNYDLPREVAEKRPSFLNFNNVLNWGGSVENAHVASVSCLNSKHGCFGDAYDFIKMFFEDQSTDNEHTKEVVCDILNSGQKIPGFGSPIFKGESSTDKRCYLIKDMLYSSLPVEKDVERLLDIVKDEKQIDANLVFWNALSIYLLGLTKEYASLVFILATQIRYINSLHDTNIEQ